MLFVYIFLNADRSNNLDEMRFHRLSMALGAWMERGKNPKKTVPKSFPTSGKSEDLNKAAWHTFR